ncbi:alcohol oxidase [Amylostereum chailletii]|nr:alcohol oxidase [Amylostereum chailletii]
MLQTTIAALLSLSIGVAYACIVNRPEDLPSGKTYDYIVVGSGPGGSVVGTRLSEDPSVNVLIIEAGPNVDGVEDIEIPFYGPKLIGTKYDWNFTTTAQAGLNGRSIAYSRGKGLGGSSSTNFMVYNRGSKDDWDRCANVTGDKGWSWDALQPIILGMEKLVPPADHHNTTGEINPAIHGKSGPLQVSLPGFPLPTDDRVIRATSDLPDEFPFNEDMNSGNTIGVGWTPFTISDGQRVSAYTAYLKPALSRRNLDVLVNTQVTKVVQTGTKSGLPVFKGVQFAQSSSGKRFALNATREVILSAGAVQTPQLLLLSGIGDSAALGKLGIHTIVNNKNVGRNLQDHVLLSSPYKVNSTDTFDRISQNSTFAASLVAQWEKTHTGELVLASAGQLGWLRIPSNASIYASQSDPSAGKTSGHYELIFTNGFVSFTAAPPTTGNYFSLFTNIVSPAARGSITLASSDPFAAPLVDPGLLNSKFDIFTIVEALRTANRFTQAKSWDGYILEPYGDFATAISGSDVDLEAYARKTSTTVWHPTSSVSMSKKGTSDGVLNPDLSVKNTIGLRVVDASALPFVPAAHIQIPIYILAERAARLIKGA